MLIPYKDVFSSVYFRSNYEQSYDHLIFRIDYYEWWCLETFTVFKTKGHLMDHG